MQREAESVADFVRRPQKTFQIAYGRYKLAKEMRDNLLHGQFHEGLRYELPNMSGAQSYKELCAAAKGEERR